MKKNITKLLTLMFSVTSIVMQAETPKKEAVKIHASKDAVSIKTGDALNLSEFTKTNDDILYKIIKKGSKNKALRGDDLTVHYSGYLRNGKNVGVKFDSSFDRNSPFNFKLGTGQVISGWDIMLADMQVGETRVVILPAKFAYGNRATGNIPANSSLIFEITLIKATPKETSIKPSDILTLSEFTKTNNGIMYKIVKKGTGEKPLKGEALVVNYSGYLLVDGKKVGLKFDSSLDRNTPFSFKLGAGQVIPGWDIMLAEMKVGETRIIILPSKFAYGNRTLAKIPADSSLIFEITLLKVS